jgi:hypothetical protein
MNAATQIRNQQRQWAKHAGHKADLRGYVRKVDDNLWRPLHPETRREFEQASGNELRGQRTRPAKLRALHSSAALACNVFDFWRDRDKRTLARALGLDEAISSLSFEVKLSTGLVGTPPNLDVFLTLASGRSVAIESKFTELYASRSSATPFKAKYFPKSRKLWAEVGLPRCQDLAAAVDRGRTEFEILAPAQLLKHALGIATQHRDRGALLYVFYDVAGSEGAQHRKEMAVFTDLVGGELGFRGLSYQDLFQGLGSFETPEESSFIRYLRERYFPG